MAKISSSRSNFHLSEIEVTLCREVSHLYLSNSIVPLWSTTEKLERATPFTLLIVLQLLHGPLKKKCRSESYLF